jgi:hypothetical protein
MRGGGVHAHEEKVHREDVARRRREDSSATGGIPPQALEAVDALRPRAIEGLELAPKVQKIRRVSALA